MHLRRNGMFRNKQVAIAAVVITLMGGGLLLGKSGLITSLAAPAAPEAASQKRQLTVETTTAVSEMKKPTAVFKTTLEPSEEALISAQMNGKVLRILFDNGTAVSAGAPLIQLDDRDARSQLLVAQGQLESARAALIRMETSLANTQISYDRVAALYQQGAISKAEYDNALTALNLMKADAASARAGVQSAQGALEARQIVLDNTVIRAPLAGIVDAKQVTLGQQVTPEAVLARVMQTSSIDAVFEVDQEAVGSLAVGQTAELRLQKDASQSFAGSISAIGLAADPASRVFKVRVEIPNPEGALRPGVFGWVAIEATEAVPVITLPVEAITGTDGAYSVFVAENGHAKRLAVLLGELTDNRVEIRSGLSAGAQVILTNLNTLQDGDAITVAVQ